MRDTSMLNALESAIIDFNAFLKNKNDTSKYSMIDYKNAFFQRMRKEFYTTNHYQLFNYHFSLINFNIEISNGSLSLLKFDVKNQYNSIQIAFINNINDCMKVIDLEKLSQRSEVYSNIVNVFEKTINQINSFKIK